MGSYYYLMAQLPFLVYEQKPPMSSDDFKSLAAALMSKEDRALLGYLSLDPDPQGGEGSAYAQAAPSTGCSFIDGWREWERTLRLNLAKHRAARLKRGTAGDSFQGSTAEPPSMPVDAASAAAKAVNGEGSPLDGEILIDKARWAAIEELAGSGYFCRNQAFAYFLKLLLVERRQAFNTEKGFSEYKSLYNQIIEDERVSVGEPL